MGARGNVGLVPHHPAGLRRHHPHDHVKAGGLAGPSGPHSPLLLAEPAARRIALVTHISSRIVAVLIGPWQFLQRLRQRFLHLHRLLGRTYLIAVAAGSVAAQWLALTTTKGWAWGIGVAMLGVAWLATSGVAFLAIQRRQIRIHREWMVRSYIAIFAFVTFRVFVERLLATHVVPAQDVWITGFRACWVVRLFMAEIVLQLRQFQSGETAEDTER